MTKNFLHVPVHGRLVMVELTDSQENEMLARGVGGSYERVRIDQHLTMWMNEDGIRLNLPFNPRAQRVWHLRFGPHHPTMIRGGVVLTGVISRSGYAFGLSGPTIQSLRTKLLIEPTKSAEGQIV